MSDTPRTDAQSIDPFDADCKDDDRTDVVPTPFAQSIERELIIAENAIEDFMSHRDSVANNADPLIRLSMKRETLQSFIDIRIASARRKVLSNL